MNFFLVFPIHYPNLNLCQGVSEKCISGDEIDNRGFCAMKGDLHADCMRCRRGNVSAARGRRQKSRGGPRCGPTCTQLGWSTSFIISISRRIASTAKSELCSADCGAGESASFEENKAQGRRCPRLRIAGPVMATNRFTTEEDRERVYLQEGGGAGAPAVFRSIILTAHSFPVACTMQRMQSQPRPSSRILTEIPASTAIFDGLTPCSWQT
jgi:hypothetical protein